MTTNIMHNSIAITKADKSPLFQSIHHSFFEGDYQWLLSRNLKNKNKKYRKINYSTQNMK